MNLPWQYIYQKIKTRFYRGLILIITDVGTEWLKCFKPQADFFQRYKKLLLQVQNEIVKLGLWIELKWQK